ncbi:MAG TPA: cytochrome b/b6 domain-containing protein [Campylobacterales bacterium]|nr:cytochrome b/b6 domain-containing protein [Campylobacterales bacterium]
MDTKNPTKQPVWDLPTRIFHWGLALSVSLSMLIVYGKSYLDLHIVSGLISFVLIAGRLVWGFVGTKYVRFGSFLKGADDIKAEFSSFQESSIHRAVGHPAIAGWVMLLLMLCAFCVGVSGIWLWLVSDVRDSKEVLLGVHEIFANTLLIIAFIHVQGVLLHIFLHRDAIVIGMIDGKRPAREDEAIGSLSATQRVVALVWFACAIIVSVWALRFV